MDYKELMLRALRASNTSLNIYPGFPLYDILVTPVYDLYTAIDSQLNSLAVNVDYSQFFDSNGNIIDNNKYEILKNNFFLGDLLTEKASVVLNLYFSSIVTEISIPGGTYASKDGKRFLLPAGTFTDMIWNTSNNEYYAQFTATAEETGSDYNGINPGTWILNFSITGVTTVTSDVASSGGLDSEQKITYPFISSIINNRGWDNLNSITFHLFNDIINYSPSKYSIISLNDQELEESTFMLGNDSMTTGTSASLLSHFAVETKEFLVTDLQFDYFNNTSDYVYEIPDYVALYGVESVKDYSGTVDLPFTVDYIYKRIFINKSNSAKITLYTTSYTSTLNIKQQIDSKNAELVSGNIITRGFYPVNIYVDTTCGIAAADVDTVNTSIANYFSTLYNMSDINYSNISAYILQTTGKQVTKVKAKYGANTEIDLNTTVNLFPTSYSFTKWGKTIPVSDKNHIPIGGLSR